MASSVSPLRPSLDESTRPRPRRGAARRRRTGRRVRPGRQSGLAGHHCHGQCRDGCIRPLESAASCIALAAASAAASRCAAGGVSPWMIRAARAVTCVDRPVERGRKRAKARRRRPPRASSSMRCARRPRPEPAGRMPEPPGARADSDPSAAGADPIGGAGGRWPTRATYHRRAILAAAGRRAATRCRRPSCTSTWMVRCGPPRRSSWRPTSACS